MFDIWPKRCCCLIKKELKYAGPFGLAAILCGSVFIDRLNTKKALDTMKAAMKEIKEKKVSCYLSLVSGYRVISPANGGLNLYKGPLKEIKIKKK